MSRGRKPKTPELTIYGSNAPRITAPKRRCPKHLTAAQKKIWRALIKMLDQEGVYHELDTYLVEAFVVTYARWLEAEEGIVTHGLVFPAGDDGKGNPTRFDYSPYYVISNRMIQTMRQLAKQLGLSPQARGALAAATGGTAPAAGSALLTFAASRGG